MESSTSRTILVTKMHRNKALSYDQEAQVRSRSTSHFHQMCKRIERDLEVWKVQGYKY